MCKRFRVSKNPFSKPRIKLSCKTMEAFPFLANLSKKSFLKPFTIEVQFLGNKKHEQSQSDCTRLRFKNLLVERFSDISYQRC